MVELFHCLFSPELRGHREVIVDVETLAEFVAVVIFDDDIADFLVRFKLGDLLDVQQLLQNLCLELLPSCGR